MGGKSVEGDREVKDDFKLTTLVSKLNDFTTKIFEVENKCKSQRRYMPTHGSNKSIEDYKSRVEVTRQIILQQITYQDLLLDEMGENFKAFNQFIGSHSISIYHIKSLLMFT